MGKVQRLKVAQASLMLRAQAYIETLEEALGGSVEGEALLARERYAEAILELAKAVDAVAPGFAEKLVVDGRLPGVDTGT